MYYPDSPAPTPLLTRVGSKLADNYAEGLFNKQPIERAAAHAHAQSAKPTRGRAALWLAEAQQRCHKWPGKGAPAGDGVILCCQTKYELEK